MLNKKIKLLILAGVLSTGLASGAMIKSNATSTYPAQKIGDKNYINMVDLGNTIGKDHVKSIEHPVYGKGYDIYLGDKIITLFEKAPYSYINGLPFALATEKVTDADTGEEFDFPVSQSPEKNDKGELLIPIDAVAKNLGFTVTDKGIEVPDLKAESDNKDTSKDKDKDTSKDQNKVENGKDTSTSSDKGNAGTSSKPSTGGSTVVDNGHKGDNSSSESKPSHKPEQKPSKPENKPEQKPNKPEQKPEQKPSKPEEKPSKPEEKPSKPEQKPEEKPSKPEEKPSKPEEKPEQPSGVSYASFKSSLPGLGFKHTVGTTYEYGDCGGVRVTGNGAYFGLADNTPAFANATRSALSMLIPSGAGKAYSLATQGASASFNSDGRHVNVYPGGSEVYIEIEG